MLGWWVGWLVGWVGGLVDSFLFVCLRKQINFQLYMKRQIIWNSHRRKTKTCKDEHWPPYYSTTITQTWYWLRERAQKQDSKHECVQLLLKEEQR